VKVAIAITLGFMSCCVALAEPVREIEITSTPPENGQQTFTVRFTPDETVEYEKLSFDCVLQQAFTNEATDQAKGLKIHEPGVFTYRRKDVKMVTDLDANISFRVPVSLDRLQEIYGQTAFNTNHPVRVARMVITASGPLSTWSCEIPAEGVHHPPFPVKKAPPPQPFRP
jgi:hypothetical protein